MYMNAMRERLYHLTADKHPAIDAAVFVAALILMSLVDFTRYPELAGSIIYGILLVLAVSALLNLLFAKRHED